MKEYSCAELGMLIGAALGGVLAVVGFYAFDSVLFFLLVGVGVAVGVAAGRRMDSLRADGIDGRPNIDRSTDRKEM